MMSVVALACPVAACATVSTGLLMKEMQFKTLFLRRVVGNIVGSVAALGAAALGWKAWSLVIFMLISQGFGSAIVFFSARWRPRLNLRFSEMREVLVFSGSIVLGQLLSQISSRAFEVFTGVFIGLESAGYVRISLQIVETLTILVFYPVSSTLYVVISKFEGNIVRIRGAICDVYQFALLGAGLVYGMLIVLAKPLILLLLGPKWENSIIICQIVSLTFFFNSFDIPTRECIKAFGEAKKFLVMSFISSSLWIILLLIGTLRGGSGKLDSSISGLFA
jgi:O-antigen/teichoic acid export membrane protein